MRWRVINTDGCMWRTWELAWGGGGGDVLQWARKAVEAEEIATFWQSWWVFWSGEFPLTTSSALGNDTPRSKASLKEHLKADASQYQEPNDFFFVSRSQSCGVYPFRHIVYKWVGPGGQDWIRIWNGNFMMFERFTNSAISAHFHGLMNLLPRLRPEFFHTKLSTPHDMLTLEHDGLPVCSTVRHAPCS